jgi:hypothetical protein
MKALNIRQPYADQIMRGTKRIEYRSRPTKVRGRVYIYASLLCDEDTPRRESPYHQRPAIGFLAVLFAFRRRGSIALILSLTASPDETTTLIGSVIGLGNIAGGLHMIKREPASIVEIDKAAGQIRVGR